MVKIIHDEKMWTWPHRIINQFDTYKGILDDENALNKRKCLEWFQIIITRDFYVEDRRNFGKEEVFYDAKVKVLLNKESTWSWEVTK